MRKSGRVNTTAEQNRRPACTKAEKEARPGASIITVRKIGYRLEVDE